MFHSYTSETRDSHWPCFFSPNGPSARVSLSRDRLYIVPQEELSVPRSFSCDCIVVYIKLVS